MELFWTIFDKTDQKDNLGHAELFWTKHGKSEPHRARPIKANKQQLGPILLYRTEMYQSGSLITIETIWDQTNSSRTNQD